MHNMDTNKMHGEKSKWDLQKKAVCWKRHPLNSSYMSTSLPSHKPFKEDEQNMLSTFEETRANPLATFSYEFLQLDVSLLTDEQKFQKFWTETKYNLKDLRNAIFDRHGWWVKHAFSVISTWFYIYIYIII